MSHIRMNISRWLPILVGALFFTTSTPRSVANEDTPLDPADTSSPRATFASFIESCEDLYAMIHNENPDANKRDGAAYLQTKARIFRCLDLSTQTGLLRDHTASLAAIFLKETLDRIDLPSLDQIPGAAEIEALQTEGITLKQWILPHTEIIISRIEEGPHSGDYLFSTKTIERASEFFNRVKHLPYKPGATKDIYQWFLSDPGQHIAPLVRSLPNSLRTKFWGNHAVWQWLGLALTLSIATGVMATVYWFGRKRSQALRESANLVLYCLSLAFPIAAMLIPLLVGNIVRDQLRISGSTLTIVMISTSIIFLLAAMHVIVAAGSRIAELIISSPNIHPKGLDAQLVRIVCRVLAITASTVVFLEGGKHLGIPITTLLAGAGVGGLALALAAQDSLKNFFGSMMIILDKPYRIGERVVIKGHDGFVEEIGLRSTKLRLLTGHQMSIPNEEAARSDIENIGRRPHIRRLSNIRLPLDTSPELAERAVEIVRSVLDEHEGMNPELPPRIYFNEINDDSLNLLMCYWFHPPDYDAFLAHSQQINLHIGREFAAAGLQFALPTRSAYIDDRAKPTAATTSRPTS